MAYWILKAVLTPLLRGLFRVRVEGREHVARRGAVILAANHRSFMDSLFLPLVVPRRMTFVAKAEYFDDPRSAWFFRAVGQIPIRRDGGDASERALASASEVLARGQVFGIYPEGTRTRDGLLHRGHTGAARLALRHDVPIVPVGIVGSDDIQPPDRKLPRLFRRVTIRFGEPLDLERFTGLADDHRALRALTDELMYDIQQLSGYEYVDTYATRTVEQSPVEAPARIVGFDDVGITPPSAVA